jgi:hypothetical protein
LNITAEEIASAIAEVLRTDVELEGDLYRYGIDIPANFVMRSRLEEIADTLKSWEAIDVASLAGPTSFEVLVEPSRGDAPRGRMWREQGVVLIDEQLDLKYELGVASPEYTSYLLLSLRAEARELLPRLLSRSLVRPDREKTAAGVFEVLNSILRVLTLRISAGSPHAKEFWQPCVDSFLFQLGYNIDVALLLQRDFSNVVRPSRITRLRRMALRDLDPPRRRYLADLVYHYQLGISSESPMLEYLSYYHVAEHWFDAVYRDDLIDKVQARVTSPSFSYKRRKDMDELVRLISKEMQLRDNRIVIDELRALRLVLLRDLDFSQLAQDLDEFDSSLLMHYRNNKVEFADAPKVDLRGSDREAMATGLGKRIYATRNALVHSKDGSRARFIPFKHDTELAPEVPLLRFIAEQIIMKNSRTP